MTFDSYATKLEATLKDGVLTGTYGGSSGHAYAFQAKRREPSPVASADQHAPDISGLWELQVKSPKGESAWQLVVSQAARKLAPEYALVRGFTQLQFHALQGHAEVSDLAHDPTSRTGYGHIRRLESSVVARGESSIC